ncbi:MAG TPA: NIL domain-containing protein [Chthonomonadales bacterium]|nr:NIL domain-containing protein [Chthonomonadales bacterium]
MVTPGVTRRVRLEYPIHRVREPILYHLIVDFGLIPNVYRARIDLNAGGFIELDISGAGDALDRALEWVERCGVRVTQSVDLE